MVDLMVVPTKMNDKPSTSNKVFLIKILFNMMMIDESLIVEHLNNFNTVTNQLCSICSKFDDEVKALLLLSSLPENWDGLVTTVSNSSDNLKLNFDDVVGLVLNEEAQKKASWENSKSSMSKSKN